MCHLAAQVPLVERLEPFLGPGDLGLPRCEGVLHDGAVARRAREIPVEVVVPLVEARPAVRPCRTRWNQ